MARTCNLTTHTVLEEKFVTLRRESVLEFLENE